MNNHDLRTTVADFAQHQDKIGPKYISAWCMNQASV